jgi:hypothetical protein
VPPAMYTRTIHAASSAIESDQTRIDLDTTAQVKAGCHLEGKGMSSE